MPVSMEYPHPRFNAKLAVQDDVLYIYGGTFEKGDREFMFDDLYAIDLSKMDGCKQIFSRPVDDWVDSEENQTTRMMRMTRMTKTRMKRTMTVRAMLRWQTSQESLPRVAGRRSRKRSQFPTRIRPWARLLRRRMRSRRNQARQLLTMDCHTQG